MAGPEGDRIIHVDMTTQTVTFEDFPAEWKLLGGRGLSAKILTRDCDPTCDPLGPDNVLVMAPGVLSGSSAPTYMLKSSSINTSKRAPNSAARAPIPRATSRLSVTTATRAPPA